MDGNRIDAHAVVVLEDPWLASPVVDDAAPPLQPADAPRQAQVAYANRPEPDCDARDQAKLDFKSQYVAVNDLMGLQAFRLARDVTARDCTADLTAWLRSVSASELLDQLREPGTWRRLCVLVLCRPDGATLPARADFTQNRTGRSARSAGARNIGQVHLRSETPLWYTLADVLAAALRDGRAPHILRAVEFVPGAERVETQARDLFGDPAQRVDPQTDTVWTRFIDVRRARKREASAARAAGRMAEAARLDGQQHALKEVALAGSYGVLEELNEQVYEGKELTIHVYALGRTRRHGNVVEEPGPYFAGAIGPFIPAGGRLLLAICERLLRDRRLRYAFMDTDSVTPIRPSGMSRAEFERRVQEVVDWFTGLCPYAEGGSLLAYEEQNYAVDPDNPNAVDTARFERLWCIAVSAKRYVEYNRWRDADGRLHIRLRKFSSHGLGQWGRREGEGDALPDSMDPPHTFRELRDADGRVVTDEHGRPVRIPDSAPLGGPLWVYRLWWDFVFTMIEGRYPNGEPLYRNDAGRVWYRPRPEPWLDAPAYTQFSVETWTDVERVRHLPGMRPGGFITVYPSNATRFGTPTTGHTVVAPADLVTDGEDDEDEDDDASTGDGVDEGAEHEGVLTPTSEALYSPYCPDSAAVMRALRDGQVRRVKDDAVMPPDTDLKTLYEVVAPYFMHGEAKAADPYGVGALRRRRVEVADVDVSGKESNRLAQAAAEDTAEVLGGREQLGGRTYGATGTAGEMNGHGGHLSSLYGNDLPDLLAASCLSRRTLERLARTDHEPLPETVAAMAEAMRLLDPGHLRSIVGWRDVLTAEVLADLLGIGVKEARDRLCGRCTWTEAEREHLVRYMARRHARVG